MKITAVKTNTKPALESVILTLTPREAFCLQMLLGNQHVEDMQNICNRNHYSTSSTFAAPHILGEVTWEEARKFEDIYEKLHQVLINA